MKVKKIPMRKCVISNQVFEKSLLTRVVVSKDGEVSVDTTSKANGRGAYLLLTKENVTKAMKTKKLDRSLKVEIPKVIYEELLGLCDNDSK